MPRAERFHVSIGEALYTRLKQHAAEKHASITSVVDKALADLRLPEYRPLALTRQAYALLVSRSEQWGCSPSEAVTRMCGGGEL